MQLRRNFTERNVLSFNFIEQEMWTVFSLTLALGAVILTFASILMLFYHLGRLTFLGHKNWKSASNPLDLPAIFKRNVFDSKGRHHAKGVIVWIVLLALGLILLHFFYPVSLG